MPASIHPQTGKITEYPYTKTGKQEYRASIQKGSVPVRGKTAEAMDLDEGVGSPEDFLNRPNTYGG